MNKLGDISTHLSCGEILALQKAFGQLNPVVTSRDIKANSPFKRLYASPDEAQTKQNKQPTTRPKVFSGEIQKMIECPVYELERKRVIHLNSWINKPIISPSERHAFLWSVKEVHCLSCDDRDDWREEVVLKSEEAITAIFSTSGRYALAAAKGFCKVWGFEDGASWVKQAEINNLDSIKNVQFSPTERALAIASSDDDDHDTFMLCVYQVDRGWVQESRIRGVKDLSFQFSPSGNDILVTSKSGGTMFGIDYNGKVRCQYLYPNCNNKQKVRAAFSEAGDHAAIFTETVYSDENTLKIIGRVGDHWQEVGSLNYPRGFKVNFSKSARHLMIHTNDQKIILWSLNDKGIYVETNVIHGQPLSVYTAFSASENILLTANHKNGLVQILSYNNSRDQWIIKEKGYYGDADLQVCFSDDPASNCIMINERKKDGQNNVHVVHVSNEARCQFKKIQSKEKIYHASISPSGRYVLTTHDGGEGLIAMIWSFDSEGNSMVKARIYRPATANNYFSVHKAIFSATEQMLRLCWKFRFSTTIILWGCDDNGLWTERGVIDHAVNEVDSDDTVHSHGMLQILARDEDGDFKIHGYDSNGHWREKAVGNTGTKLSTGSFSPSGRVLFTCDDDRSASIWKITPSE
ncbi:WD40 repeat domain-containing protein [Thalassotalea sp. G20_0]|uniref:WD40 repeat domain-containing protein n=1 Tax=Thalassotalea sp. G20_0 TaxID=2821093 RepID=UPI001ADC1110|nr:WD40 repeat domain-containing protein [Thalassotalea sp. G20_0]MBO9496790.1 WD40 repeat domain-containing protein [Thalassotalea sp. G20_0]